MHLTTDDFAGLESLYRRHFMNTLPGPRGVHLIGTLGYKGTPNLGVFNSVVHISASPPHLGFILRPLTVPRHTYHHLKAQGYFTVNTIHRAMLPAAHQTSANYPLEESEFEAVGLTPQYADRHPAPYVKESRVKIGLAFVEEHRIGVNDTRLIIGRVEEIIIDEAAVAPSGHVDHQALGTLGVMGLDTYFDVQDPTPLPYARP
ncbi:MAG: flavin reductase [Lewinella sp.]|nr:flavin reductase [Lewinella sp.]